MKKILLSLVILVSSFSIATAAASCGYGFITSCGGTYYTDGPCDWSDETVLEIYDMFEYLDCGMW